MPRFDLTNKPQLEPCPCCGHKTPTYGFVEDRYDWVICGSCGLKAFNIDTEPELDPVTVWNRRSTQGAA